MIFLRQFLRQHCLPTLRITMLLWVGFWFAVIAPGHMRGVVKTLDGATPGEGVTQPVIAGLACPSCVPADPVAPSESSEIPEGPGNPGVPTGGDCLICHINATLTVPPPLVLYQPKGDRIALLPCVVPMRPHTQTHRSPVLQRGPPLA